MKRILNRTHPRPKLWPAFALVLAALIALSMLPLQAFAVPAGDEPAAEVLQENDGGGNSATQSNTGPNNTPAGGNVQDSPAAPRATYTVTFVDYDSTLLATYTVAHGQASPAPQPPSRAGYAFTGWDTDTTSVTESLTVTALYRELLSYTIQIEYVFADGSVAAQAYMAEVKEGFALTDTVPSPTVAGYLPDQPAISINIPAAYQNAAYTVVYTPASGTAYTVTHYLEDLSPAGQFTPHESATLYGETGETVVANAKQYTGFSPVPPLAEGEIAADGSLVLEVYYTRDVHTLTFEANGGTYVEPITARFGETVTPPPPPARAGHSFAGWDTPLPPNMPAEDMAFVATWDINTTADYLVVYMVENADDDGYTVMGSEIKTGSVGDAPDLPNPINPFPAGVVFPGTTRLAVENAYEYNETKTLAANAGSTIDAEKSTVVNVYYDRKTFTIQYYFAGNTGAVNQNLHADYVVEINGVRRPYADLMAEYPDTATTYTISGKYMQSIRSQVPYIYYEGSEGVSGPLKLNAFVQNWNFEGYAPFVGQSTISYWHFVSTTNYYFQGYEATVRYDFSVGAQTSYQYTPMFEPVGGAADRDGYFAGAPYTIHFSSSSQSSVQTPSYTGFFAPEPLSLNNPDFHGIPWDPDTKVYYARQQYKLAYLDGTNTLAEKTLWYQEPLAAYNYTPDTPVDKPGYTFGGWHTSSTLHESTLLEFGRAYMPAQQMTLYAKWIPPVYEVKFDLDGGTGTAPTQNIQVGGYIAVPTPPTRDGYTFAGWKERNGTVAYNTAYPVNRHLDLVAIWQPGYSGSYTVYFRNSATNTDLAAPETVTNLLVGSSHTATAAGIPGYLPDAVSKGIALRANSLFNSIVFYYEPFTSVSYTLRYEMLDGTQLLPEEALSTGNVYVTHNFKAIPGYYPVEEQITLQLSQNTATNLVVFRYLAYTDVLYKVEHYQQDLDGVNYTLATSQALSGSTGTAVNAAPNSYTGFAYNSALSTASGTIAGDGSLILKLYYDRLPLTVRFAAAGGGSLYGVADYSGILYGTPFGRATGIPTPQPNDGYVFKGWSPALPDADSPVTQDAVYTALFEAAGTVPPPPVTTSSSSRPSSSRTPSSSSEAAGSSSTLSSSSGGGSSSLASSEVPRASSSSPPAESLPNDTSRGTQALDGDGIPLFSFDYSHWSLLSLFMSIAALLSTLVLLLRSFGSQKQRTGALRIAAMVMGVLTAILFFVLDNLSQPVGWINQNTIWVALSGLVFVALALLQARKKEDDVPETET